MWRSSSNTQQEQKSCWQMQRMPLDMLQLNESIPYVSIDHSKKAIGEGRRLFTAGNRQKFVGLGGKDAEKMCQRSAVKRRRPVRGLEESNVEQHGFSLSRVRPHCGLFPIRRFHFGGCRPTINQSRKKRDSDWWCAACGADDTSMLHARRHGCSGHTRHLPAPATT